MNEERAWIDQAIEKTIGFVQQGGQFDMSLQVTIPNEFERIAPVNVGYTAGIETTRVAHQWISKGNEMDKILVISSHSKNTFEQTVYEGVNEQTGESVHLRLNTPIEVINYPVKFHDDLPDLQLKFDYDYNFLTIAQFGPRKNLPNTIKWFVEEFENEEVGLIVKSNIAKNCLMDREKLYNDLQGFLKNFPNRKCKVYLLHGDMTDEEIHSLYVHPQIKALVALPHGEGFGLPIFEAAYSGLPVVATGWSGQLDYLVDEQGKEQFYNVAFDLQQVQDQVVWDGVIIKESMWAFPREQSAKEQLRAAYNDRDSEPRTPPCIRERFEPTKMYDKFVNFLVSDTTTADDPDAWMREIDSIVKEYE